MTSPARPVVAAGAVLVGAVALAAGCGSGGSTASTTTTPSPTTTTTAPQSSAALTLTGVAHGVGAPPFYPAAHVTAVTCTTSPAGVTVTVAVPAGAAGTTKGTALLEATTLTVTAGQAVVADAAGRVLYRQADAGVTTDAAGSFVLSLTAAAKTSTAGHPVAAGGFNVEGSYRCP